MTTNHKLVITLPDEYDLNTTDGTITMTVAQAREWARSILDATPTGTTKREELERLARETRQTTRDFEELCQKQRDINAVWKAQAQRRNLNAEWQGQVEHTPPKVDNLARTSGLFRKR